jgi:hypothetical protein
MAVLENSMLPFACSSHLLCGTGSMYLFTGIDSPAWPQPQFALHCALSADSICAPDS